MLRTTITTIALAAFVVVLATTATPARATMHALFTMGGLRLTYDYDPTPEGEGVLKVFSTADYAVSNLTAKTFSDQDSSLIFYDDTALNGSDLVADGFLASQLFGITLQMKDEPGANNWSASGSLFIGDKDGEKAVYGTFTSTAVLMVSDVHTNNTRLKIEGILRPFEGGPKTILRPSDTSPWIYAGKWDTPGIPDGDGTPNQISLAPTKSYKEAIVASITFAPGLVSEDSFFTMDTITVPLEGGTATVTITPTPEAVVLGLLGLSIVGIRMRRHA